MDNIHKAMTLNKDFNKGIEVKNVNRDCNLSSKTLDKLTSLLISGTKSSDVVKVGEIFSDRLLFNILCKDLANLELCKDKDIVDVKVVSKCIGKIRLKEEKPSGTSVIEVITFGNPIEEIRVIILIGEGNIDK